MEGQDPLTARRRYAHRLAAVLLAGLAMAAGAIAAAAIAIRPAAEAQASGMLPVPAAVLARLRPGDLVFREGTEAVSDAVLAVDRGGYSHVGLLLGGPGHWQVLHAVPAERPGRNDGVVIDGLDFFLDRRRARRVGFYRVDASDAGRERALAFARARLGTPFRLGRAAGGTYCTELVWQAYRAGGVDLQVRFERLRLPLLEGDYLLPSALRASPRLHLLYAMY